MSNSPEALNVKSIFGVSHATRFIQVAESLGVLVLLVVVVVGASIIAPGFFTYTNLTNTLITASITAVTGLGMTFAIAMGGFDLSVGSVQVLAAIVAGLMVASLIARTSGPRRVTYRSGAWAFEWNPDQ